MGFVAVIGAGALGGATTHALARRERMREVRLIDPEGTIARGKALDLSQSAPVENFSTRVTSAEAVEAAAGADAIVIADAAANSAEHSGRQGLRCSAASSQSRIVRRLSAPARSSAN